MNTSTDYRQQQSAGAVLQSLFIQLIKEAAAHIPAVLANNNNEELHCYRVTLRRMRSILQEFKSCMDHDIYTLLKEELRQMVIPTNTLRDMDVFLENMENYKGMVLPGDREAIARIEARLSLERNENFEEVKRFVKSSEYVNMLSVITDLTQTEKFYSSCSRNDIRTVLKKNMHARLERINKKGAKLDKKSDPRRFHAQRIAVKKLRYMLETFSHLFPPQEYRSVIKTVKSLQETLGRYQDLSIQTSRLLQGFEESDTTAAVILGVLQDEQKKIRKKSLKKLQKLSDSPFQKAFKKLFD